MNNNKQQQIPFTFRAVPLEIEEQLGYIPARIYAEIYSYENNKQVCFIGNRWLKSMFHMCYNTVTKHLKSLEEAGWITIEYQSNGNNNKRRILRINKLPLQHVNNVSTLYPEHIEEPIVERVSRKNRIIKIL